MSWLFEEACVRIRSHCIRCRQKSEKSYDYESECVFQANTSIMIRDIRIVTIFEMGIITLSYSWGLKIIDRFYETICGRQNHKEQRIFR